jgi:hypothetical protein
MLLLRGGSTCIRGVHLPGLHGKGDEAVKLEEAKPCMKLQRNE